MRNKGITLIALVITIIVLLILAGITINLTVGNQGVITRAQQATKQTELRSIEERAKLVKADLDIDSLSGNFKVLIEKNVLLSKLQEEFEGSTRSGNIITTSDKKYDIVVDNDLNITVVEHDKSSGDGITLVYSLEDEYEKEVKLIVHPIIDEIGEIPTEDELYQKAQETINNLPTDEDKRNEAIDKMFIEFINIMIKSEGMGDIVFTDLNQALQFMGAEESYPSLKAYYDAEMSGVSFDQVVLEMQYAIEIFKYSRNVTVECSNGESDTITNSEYATFTITENGKYTITAEDEYENTGKIQVEITQVEGEKFSEIYEETTQITSADGQKVWIPEGFAVGINNNMDKVSKGLVITDNVDEEGYSIGNEFVWIPVPDITQMARPTGGKDSKDNDNYEGILYAFKSNEDNEEVPNSGISSGTGSREPANLTGTKKIDGTDYVYDSKEMFTKYGAGNWEETMYQEEYNSMIASVKTYGGFYVGRYEMGLNYASKNGETSANASTSSANTWYGLYSKAKNYYPSENSTAVVSSMIWGSQYDRMLNWMRENGINVNLSQWTVEANKNRTDRTGTDESDKLNNIYDLLGSRQEWTLEARENNQRTLRNNSIGTPWPPAERTGFAPPIVDDDDQGSRVTLYIK